MTKRSERKKHSQKHLCADVREDVQARSTAGKAIRLITFLLPTQVLRTQVIYWYAYTHIQKCMCPPRMAACMGLTCSTCAGHSQIVLLCSTVYNYSRCLNKLCVCGCTALLMLWGPKSVQTVTSQAGTVLSRQQSTPPQCRSLSFYVEDMLEDLDLGYSDGSETACAWMVKWTC